MGNSRAVLSSKEMRSSYLRRSSRERKMEVQQDRAIRRGKKSRNYTVSFLVSFSFFCSAHVDWDRRWATFDRTTEIPLLIRRLRIEVARSKGGGLPNLTISTYRILFAHCGQVILCSLSIEPRRCESRVDCGWRRQWIAIGCLKLYKFILRYTPAMRISPS